MAKLLGAPLFTALDPNGDPISGAKIYGYLTGTTTAVTLYQDAGLTIPHTVPVLSDSAGRFPDIYFADETATRIKVFDASNVLIADIDPVNGAASGAIGTIAGLRALTSATVGSVYVSGYYATNDGGQGTFVYDATDTTTADNGGTVIVDAADHRWKRSFNGPVYLRWFGAKGDGTTNDTAAVTNALASGYNVMIEPATFMVDPGSVLFGAAGQQLVGEDGLASIIKMRQAATGSQSLIFGNALNGLQVRNLVLDGGGFAAPLNAGLPIGLLECDDALIEGVTIQNVNRYGIAINSCDRATVRRCDITLPQLLGIRLVSLTAGSGGTPNQTNLHATVTGGSPTYPETVLYDTTAGGAVTNVRFQQDSQGYTVANGPPTVTFPAVANASCVVALAGTAVFAVVASASASGICHDLLIEDCTFFGAGADLSTFNATCRGNHVRAALFGAGFVTEQLSDCGQNLFDGNLIEDMGFDFTSHTWIGEDVNQTVSEGLELWGFDEKITNNVCRNNGGGGIVLGSRRCQCIGNKSFDNGRYALQQGGPILSSGISLLWGTSTFNASDAMVRNNKCYDNNGIAGGQAFGIECSSTPPTGVTIEGNDCQGNAVQDYKFRGAILASFIGRRLQAEIDWSPGTISGSGGSASTTITIAGFGDNAQKWRLSGQHLGSENLNLLFKVQASSANTATAFLYNNSSGSIGGGTGKLMVQADEFGPFYNG